MPITIAFTVWTIESKSTGRTVHIYTDEAAASSWLEALKETSPGYDWDDMLIIPRVVYKEVGN